MKHIYFLSAVTTWLCSANLLANADVNVAKSRQLTPVKIVFVEALAPRDTTSSERFRNDYTTAIEVAKNALEGRLSKCGYTFDLSTQFYDASDSVQAKELATKASKEGAWLLIGPRRSNHYLLFAQGSEKVPTVSLMASANDVSALGDIHLTLSPLNSEMARVAATEAKKKAGKAAGYVSIVSQDCVSCVDFEKNFDQSAKAIGLRPLGRIAVAGENLDPKTFVSQTLLLKPKFVLLPNYSKVSSSVMAELTKAGLRAFYVGSDGWGDSKFGFVQNGIDLVGAHGFTVRGYPSFEQGISRLPIKDLIQQNQNLPKSGPALGIIGALSSTTELICRNRPKNLSQFASVFATKGRSSFSARWGVSTFNMNDGNISFSHATKAKAKL